MSQQLSTASECPAKSLPFIEKEWRSPSGSREFVQPLRRSRSGGQRRCCIEAVRANAVAGRPSCGGRLTTELRNQCEPGALSTWRRLYLAEAIQFKVRPCPAQIEPSLTSRPAMPACLTRRSTPTCYSRLRRPPHAR
jgi:hypothetical protein